jgi:hypothetical protein
MPSRRNLTPAARSRATSELRSVTCGLIRFQPLGTTSYDQEVLWNVIKLESPDMG